MLGHKGAPPVSTNSCLTMCRTFIVLCFALLVLSLQLGLKFVSDQNVSEWFFMLLQMLAYLLLSASSAALSRNGVWMSRFGGDQFTKLINASASMAFLAFIALGLNSVISAYCVFSLVS